jgi:hypothetical protein
MLGPDGTRFQLIQSLPQRLTSLNLSCSSFSDEDILALPDSLTELLLTETGTLTDECIPAMPHNLKRLRLGTFHRIHGDIYPWPSKLTHLDLNTPDYMEVGDRFRFQPKLPSSLLCLKLSTLRSNEVFVHGLPPFLTKLVIRGNPDIFVKEWLQILPETLVKYHHPDLDMYDDDVKYLPRSLRSFEAEYRSENLSAASSKDWPPLLRKLTIQGCLFSNEAISNLPRTITDLKITGTTMCDFTTLRACFGPAIQKWSVGSFVGANPH